MEIKSHNSLSSSPEVQGKYNNLQNILKKYFEYLSQTSFKH